MNSDELVERLRKMSRRVYLAAEASVADDISDGLTEAADTIQSLTADNAVLREALESIITRATCDQWAHIACTEIEKIARNALSQTGEKP